MDIYIKKTPVPDAENMADMPALYVPIWEKYMLTVGEAAKYFGIGEKKIRFLANESEDSEHSFTLRVGTKVLINRKKFEQYLNRTSSI